MEPEYSWYASRILKDKAMILRRLESDAVRRYCAPVLPNFQFLYCTEKYIRQLMSEYWGSMFFYGDRVSKKPLPIRTREMEIFMIVTSASDELVVLSDPTPEFLAGERVRVLAGPFKGAEGVVKRIKGDRRLVVSIDGVTAVATSYIRPELLEKVVG